MKFICRKIFDCEAFTIFIFAKLKNLRKIKYLLFIFLHNPTRYNLLSIAKEIKSFGNSEANHLEIRSYLNSGIKGFIFNLNLLNAYFS